jgi:hypothetical protein
MTNNASAIFFQQRHESHLIPSSMAKPKGSKKKTKNSNTTQKAGSRRKRQVISDDDNQSSDDEGTRAVQPRKQAKCNITVEEIDEEEDSDIEVIEEADDPAENSDEVS